MQCCALHPTTLLVSIAQGLPHHSNWIPINLPYFEVLFFIPGTTVGVIFICVLLYAVGVGVYFSVGVCVGTGVVVTLTCFWLVQPLTMTTIAKTMAIPIIVDFILITKGKTMIRILTFLMQL